MILVFNAGSPILHYNNYSMPLKKYLQQFTKEQLIEQIIDLEKKYKDIKSYYLFSLNPGSALHAEKAKKAIHKFFNSPQGYDPKLREARSEVNGFKKLAPPAESLADIMLYYVECGVKFTLDYGDISGPFYNSVEGMFRDACDVINRNGLKGLYQSRCRKIVDDTADMCWGFHDELSRQYATVFEP